MNAPRYPKLTLGAALALALGLLSAVPSAGQEEPAQAEPGRGQELYQIYCSNCHGRRGLGDGPTAAVLNVVPTDLTRLAALNHGEFPAERVSRFIDGREETRAHGDRRMPIWGLVFQEYDRDTNQEAEVRFRIRELVDYLRSIQK